MKRGVLLAAVLLALLAGESGSGHAAGQSSIVFAADRAPTVTGEIYRLDPNGHRVDLSKSPYQDTDPAVSPDGKTVAFISDRSGDDEAVYEVGIDGRGLVRVGPLLSGTEPPLAWQPHGKLIAFDASQQLFIAGPQRRTVHVTGDLAGQQPWSPDGRELLVTAGGEVRAVSPRGHVAWSAPAAQESSATWSAKGLAAFPDATDSIVVYDETGHLRFRTRIAAEYGAPSWSPDGSRLALIAWPRLLEWTSAGKLVLDRRAKPGNIVWAGRHWLITTHWPSRWLDPRSPDGKLAIVTSPPGSAGVGSRFAVGVAPAGGGGVRTYAHVPGCLSDGSWVPTADALQFAGRSIVYERWGGCDPPFSNLYSAAPAGGSATRLTDVQAQETQPAVSPNGGEIAYVWAEATGTSCKGCSDGIRVASATGTPLRTLTDPQDCTFDDSPTWSPDGSTILFAETDCDNENELYTIAADGGRPHDLGVEGSEPAWGPSKIAYEGAGGVWTANPDGSDATLVGPKGDDPAWSPAGRLAYLVGDVFHSALVVGTRRVGLPFGRVTSLDWSRGGTRLIVTASKTRLGPSDLYTVEPNGSNPLRLTRNFGVWSDYFGPGS